MKASSRRVQRLAALRATAYVCLQALVVGSVTTVPGLALAEPDQPVVPEPGAPAAPQASDTSPAAVVAARELFREATEDADAKRHTAALEKFQRVARIRDTGAVRFNIGQCEERLGRIASALASYELAASRAQYEPRGADIVSMARAAAEPLRARAPRLTLVASPLTRPKDLSVLLDGAPVPTASFGVALPVDPGEHAIDAEASGHLRRHWTVKLAEGHAETIDIALGEGIDPGLAPGPRPLLTGTAERSQPDATWWSTRRGLGVAALGLGAGAAIVSTVFVVRHNGGVSDLRAACDPRCPEARRGELEATRDAAVRDQTLAFTAAALAGAALITGAILIFWPTPHRDLQATPAGVAWQF